MVNLFCCHPRLTNGHFHGPTRAVTVFRASGQVISIGAGAVADQLCQRGGTARQRVFQRLNHDKPGAFSHHKTIAVAVKGAGSRFRLVIGCAGERSCCGKPGKANAMNCRFCAAAEGDIRLATADHPCSIANGLRACRAGGDRRADWGHGNRGR
ncbi:Uncharacterised protein [Raoultella planticola]|uniref:Uncharacterized protein n=1 Tax=Raoultella planticola TaxID=575 RepID=A0A485D845_RAOPL|nr:Uncharacterised protein [Raoultella planticola]